MKYAATFLMTDPFPYLDIQHPVICHGSKKTAEIVQK